MIEGTAKPDMFTNDGFMLTLIPFKSKETNKFRYNHRILIFEDNRDTIEQLRSLFMRYNLRFEGEFNYEKLLEHLFVQGKVDLVIIDKKLLKKNLIGTTLNFLFSVKIPFLYLDGPITDHNRLYSKVLELLSNQSE